MRRETDAQQFRREGQPLRGACCVPESANIRQPKAALLEIGLSDTGQSPTSAPIPYLSFKRLTSLTAPAALAS